MNPRPILKREPARYDSDLPFEYYGVGAVHFPPQTSLIQQYDAHPSSTYDRSPIVVSPNSCALPARGCPGRTYNADEAAANSPYPSSPKRSSYRPGGHVHPRALPSQSPSYPYQSSPREPPPLVPDLSSESEESDGFISPPPEPANFPSVRSIHPTSHALDKYPSPSLYTSIPSYPSSPTYSQSLLDSKPRHRRERPSPRRTASDESHTSSTPRRTRRDGSSSLCAAMSSFRIQDDDGGCLDGF